MKALACVNREAEKVARIIVNGEPSRLRIWLRQDCKYGCLCRAEVFNTAGRCSCCSLSTLPVCLAFMTTTESSHVPMSLHPPEDLEKVVLHPSGLKGQPAAGAARSQHLPERLPPRSRPRRRGGHVAPSLRPASVPLSTVRCRAPCLH